MTTATTIVLVVAAVILVASALLALFRLAKGPTGLDRGVASDVLLSILIASISLHAIVTRTSLGLIVIVVLSLLGFTGAVGLARLITGVSVRERRYLEAEARSARAARDRAAREATQADTSAAGEDGR